MKKTKFNSFLTATRELKDNISFAENCEDGIAKIVEFFEKINQYEFLYRESNIEDRTFFSNKKNVLVKKMGNLLKEIGRNSNEWNRTRNGENPSSDSIFIVVNPEDLKNVDLCNLIINIETRNVATIKERAKCIKCKYFGINFKIENEIMNLLASYFMKEKFLVLKNALDEYDESNKKGFYLLD